VNQRLPKKARFSALQDCALVPLLYLSSGWCINVVLVLYELSGLLMDALHDPNEGEIPSIHKKSKLSSLPNFAAKHGKDRESEIDRVIDTLQRATQVREAHHVTPAQDVAIPTILETILDRMWDVVDPAEKLVWISKDILKVLVKTICLNARRSQSYSTAIEVI